MIWTSPSATGEFNWQSFTHPLGLSLHVPFLGKHLIPAFPLLPHPKLQMPSTADATSITTRAASGLGGLKLIQFL